jgi:hypothetical protein
VHARSPTQVFQLPYHDNPTNPTLPQPVSHRIEMAIQVASTPAAPLSAKTAQVTGQKKNGKNWHENKAAFRPNSGLTSYAKRAEKQKQEAEVKKMEKEMKEEKEQERQVRPIIIWVYACCNFLTHFCREKSKLSRTSVLRKKKRSATSFWPLRCTQSVWTVSGAERRGTRCSSPRVWIEVPLFFLSFFV